MKHLYFALAGALLLFSSCASHGQATKQERRAGSKELDMQIDNLADQIILGLSHQETRTIAIVEFSDLNGMQTNFGKYLAEELTTRLFKTGKFHIVERQLMNKILEEQKLSATGLVVEENATKFGQFLAPMPSRRAQLPISLPA